MTLEEWADMDEDEPGELVDGRLVEEEVPNALHETAVKWLMRTLGDWGDPQAAWVFGSEMKFAVSPTRGRKPDVSMFAPGTRLAARAPVQRTPPLLVVEVLSPTPRDVRRDRLDKSREYARFGVRFYWLVDTEMRLLEVFELGADGQYNYVPLAAEGKVAVPGVEGLELDLDALWALLDRVEHGEQKPPEPSEG
jgi:Uma2 family endonuclease